MDLARLGRSVLQLGDAALHFVHPRRRSRPAPSPADRTSWSVCVVTGKSSSFSLSSKILRAFGRPRVFGRILSASGPRACCWPLLMGVIAAFVVLGLVGLYAAGWARFCHGFLRRGYGPLLKARRSSQLCNYLPCAHRLPHPQSVRYPRASATAARMTLLRLQKSIRFTRLFPI